jgi:hypothetical protein
MNTWESIKTFYMENFGIDPILVELAAIQDVLLLSVSGSSNDSISRFLDLDLDVIVDILDTALSFQGWKEDLEVNPYKILSELIELEEDSLEQFTHEVYATALGYTIELISQMYVVCKRFHDIEHRLDTEWR